MNYWWVNQNQSYATEVAAGYLWCPKTKSNGYSNHYYNNMLIAEPGDIVFSYADSKIKAIGMVINIVKSSRSPTPTTDNLTPLREGWLLDVEFIELTKPIEPRTFINELLPHLPNRYAPIQKNGNGYQFVYLANLPDEMANILINKIGIEYYENKENLKTNFLDVQINETTKKQIIDARIGQGIFKTNVRLIEKRCRVTGTTNIAHLRASHIKPWSDSNDDERLSGFNGLLLAPHIDHLFDGGFISFNADGTLLKSRHLDANIILQWSINDIIPTPFKTEQLVFLNYHRNNIFKL